MVIGGAGAGGNLQMGHPVPPVVTIRCFGHEVVRLILRSPSPLLQNEHGVRHAVVQLLRFADFIPEVVHIAEFE